MRFFSVLVSQGSSPEQGNGTVQRMPNQYRPFTVPCNGPQFKINIPLLETSFAVDKKKRMELVEYLKHSIDTKYI